MKQFIHFKTIKKVITLRYVVLIFFTLCFAKSNAQVSIGSGDPPQNYSILEIVSKSDNPGGLRLPQLSSLDKANIDTDLLNNVSKGKGLLIYNTDTNDIEYWDGTQWVVAKQVEPWMVSGSTEVSTLNTQNIYQMGRVTIGTSLTADSTAALNVVATDKGVLLPRVSLESYADVTTINNPTRGLLVYNTGEGMLEVEGYLYWNGSEWVQLIPGTTKLPEIAALDCTNAKIVPSRYEAGVPYEGVLIVPYVGGNGGYYSSEMPIQSTGVMGLIATLQPRNLAYGNGELIYTLSGIPNASSPQLATFNIDFLNIQCQATVGSNSLTRGEMVFWHGSMPANIGGTVNSKQVIASDYVDSDMPIIEDVFRLDAYFNGTSSSTAAVYPFIPRIYNISSQPVKFWWGGMTSQEGRGRSNVVLASGGYQDLENGMYMFLGENMLSTSSGSSSLPYGTNSQETMTIDLFYNKKWFRIFFTGWVDNHDVTTTGSNLHTRELYITYERMY